MNLDLQGMRNASHSMPVKCSLIDKIFMNLLLTVKMFSLLGTSFRAIISVIL